MSDRTIKERPILFSDPMVLALLDGRKTQTRRVMRLRTPVRAHGPGEFTFDIRQGGRCFVICDQHGVVYECPYGRVGDRLWVRENYGLVPTTAYGNSVPHRHDPDDPAQVAIYAADWERAWEPRVRPSIFMPRWAARLTLEITDVRAERLQDISGSDARKEGAKTILRSETAFIYAFAALWEGINAKRPGCTWEDNPWVWAISFRKVETE